MKQQKDEFTLRDEGIRREVGKKILRLKLIHQHIY